MRFSLDRPRLFEIAILALLGICVAQVVYWILEEASYTTAVEERLIGLFEADARAASRMLEEGVGAEELRQLYPHLLVSDEGGQGVGVAVDPETLQALDRERHGRLNRYGWEGSFFLVVLLSGMGILVRTLRRDADLRRRQQNFLAAVTHEFKSPLASMRLSAETLELRDPEPEARGELVGRLLSELDRLEGMVTDLLDTTRLEEGALEHRPDAVDLAALGEELIARLEPAARERSVSLTCALEPAARPHADATLVRIVLSNLLDNAIAASARAGGGEVSLESERAGQEVRLRVRDGGVGFPPSEASLLFEKFYRPGDELRRDGPGTGLGLYLVRSYVELEGGRVEAESGGPGQGALFTVHWPTTPGVRA